MLVAPSTSLNKNVNNSTVRPQQRQTAKKQELEIAKKAAETAETQKVEVAAPVAEQKPIEQPKTTTPTKTTTTKTTPTYTSVTIPTTNAEVGNENVVLTAKLPASYSGTCKAMVKTPDGNNVQYFEANFSSADKCSVTVSRGKLTAGASWKFYMYFKSSDGLTKGESAGNLFEFVAQ